MASKSKYYPSLDGLRALAVVSVIIYHLKASWLPCGLLGVTIFFVLSGYLITGLLIKELGTTGTICLKQFWLRRARRLIPAIITVIAVMTLLFALYNPYMLEKIKQDLAGALLFFTNWSYILRDLSYFEAMDAPSPLTHFWSLAIEEQFYIIWPLILLFLSKLRVPRKAMEGGIIVLILASALEMALLFVPDSDPTRVYYGTDTRAFSLLIGAFLAFAFPASRFSPRSRRALSPGALKFIDVAAVFALIAIIIFMFTVDQYSTFLYRGGILLVSVLTGIVILSLMHEGSFLCRLFSLKPFVWIGLRSYGIYLWHYPLLILMNPVTSTLRVPTLVMLIEVAIIFIVAALSYHFIENPIRHGCIGRFFKQAKGQLPEQRQDRSGRRKAPAQSGGKFVAVYLLKHSLYIILSIAVVGGAIAVLIKMPQEPVLEQTILNALKKSLDFTDENRGEKRQAEKENTEQRLSVEEQESAAALEAQKRQAQADALTLEQALTLTANDDVLFIGDSVPLGAESYFYYDFPIGTLDGDYNRSVYSFDDVYYAHVAAGWSGDTVIMSLGTADEVDYDRFIAAVDTVPSSMRLFIVTLRNHFDTQAGINDILWQIASERSNVRIIDWYGYTVGSEDLIIYDGIHLTDQGGKEYMDLVAMSVAKDDITTGRQKLSASSS